MPESVNIQIGGDVTGTIVAGDNNFVVNTNYGTIVHKQGPQVRLSKFSPKPPRPSRGFVNRSDELNKLESWIAANEIVLLYAPDGMGKTSLLRQVANSKAGLARPNGVILLENADIEGQVLGPTDIIQRLFDALFESDPPLKVDTTSARTYLSNTRPLILFDEVPLPAALLHALPDFFPQGAIIITADLPSSGEFQHLSIGPLPRNEAISLLATKAGIQNTEKTHKTLDLLCAHLGNVSLAIIICANVMRELNITPETVLQEFLKISASEPNPGTELERAFEFAFSKLRLQERKIISTAALTPGISMTPEWLGTALGGVASAPFIERLKAMGLLFENSPRLRLPPGFQLSARRAAVLEEQVVLSRLADYLLVNAENNLQNWEFFKDELGNLSGTLAWAIRTKNWEIAMRLVRAIDPYLSLHGLWDAWREALDSMLLAAQQTGNQAAEAWALHQLGTREIGIGTRQQALDFLRRALEIRRGLGDTIGMSYTQHNIDFLISPPPAPRGNRPKSPARTPPRKGINWLLLIGTVGFIGLVLLAILIGPMLFVRPAATATRATLVPPVVVVPTRPPNTFTSIPNAIPPTDKPTPIIISTHLPTATSIPTPVGGGSGRIAFASDATGNYDIFLMDIVTANKSALTNSSRNDNSPSWSPSGSQIAFDSDPDGRVIFVKDIYEATEPRQVTDYSEDSNPAWSPDGQKIAFVSERDGNAEIYVMNADGSGQTNLTKNAAFDADPTWSPDSNQIAFASNREGSGFQIYVMNADGTEQIRLPNNRRFDTWNSFPNWSHDGTRIVFQSQDNGDSPFQIYVMSVYGEDDPLQLTFEGNNEGAEWSLDDRLIAFTTSRDGNSEVYMMNADGTGQINLTKNPAANDSSPSWQPGGGQ